MPESKAWPCRNHKQQKHHKQNCAGICNITIVDKNKERERGTKTERNGDKETDRKRNREREREE